LSEVSGTMWVRYSHEPWNATLPLTSEAKVSLSTTPPAAYIIPPQWTHVIDVLAAHDLAMRRTTAAWTGKVEHYRCSDMEWQGPPFEGRHPIFHGEGAGAQPGRFGACTLTTESLTFPAGSMVVTLDQRLSKVAIQWLEPEAPDSALRWGFFDPIFEQREYGEAYVLEKLARENMEKDPALSAACRRIRILRRAPRRGLNSSTIGRPGELRTMWASIRWEGCYRSKGCLCSNDAGLVPRGTLESR